MPQAEQQVITRRGKTGRVAILPVPWLEAILVPQAARYLPYPRSLIHA